MNISKQQEIKKGDRSNLKPALQITRENATK